MRAFAVLLRELAALEYPLELLAMASASLVLVVAPASEVGSFVG